MFSSSGFKMGAQGFVKRFARAQPAPATYLAHSTDRRPSRRRANQIEVLSRPQHYVTIGFLVAAAYLDRSLAPRLLDAEKLSPDGAEWARGPQSITSHS